MSKKKGGAAQKGGEANKVADEPPPLVDEKDEPPPLLDDSEDPPSLIDESDDAPPVLLDSDDDAKAKAKAKSAQAKKKAEDASGDVPPPLQADGEVVGVANTPNAWKEKGNEYYKKNMFDEAVSCYTAAIDKGSNPSDAAIYYCNRATAYQRLNKLTEALNDALNSMKLNPEHLKAYSRAASLYEAMNMNKEALGLWRSLLVKNPQSQEAIDRVKELARTIEREQFHEDPSIPQLEDSSDSERDSDSEAREEKGDALVRQGNKEFRAQQYQVAVDTYSRALGKMVSKEGRALVHRNRGSAFQKVGNLERSTKDYEKSIQLDPGHVRAYYNLAMVLQEQGNHERSLDFWNVLCVLLPEDEKAKSGQEACRAALEAKKEELTKYTLALQQLLDKNGISYPKPPAGFNSKPPFK